MDDKGNISLFRHEAVADRRSRTGAPSGNLGLSSWVLPGFMTILFLSACIFLFTAKYTRTESVLGQVVPAEGVAKIAPLKAGIIEKVWVKSGQTVKYNQPLFSLSYDLVLSNGDPLSVKLNDNSEEQTRSLTEQWEAKGLQVAQDQVAMHEKIDGLKTQIDDNSQQRDLQARRLKLLEETADATQKLVDQQYASPQVLRQRQDDVLQAEQNLLQIDQNIKQSKSEIAQLTAQLASNKLIQRENKASMRLGRAQLQQGELGQHSSAGGEVVALKEGRITNVQVRSGDIVAAGQTLGLIVPRDASTLEEVTLWVPSRSIGFVRVGNKVRIMFDAFPYQTYGVGIGKVVEISSAPLNPNELPIPTDSKEPMYKILVVLNSNHLNAYGKDWSLMPGMRLTADLILDQKSLFDWMIDPLVAVKRRSTT